MMCKSAMLEIFLGFLSITGCLALKDLKIYVPMAVIRGHDAMLNCTYDLEGDDLYSVKWYRHESEFFRYTPNDEKPIKLFKIQGLSLDVREADSTANTVVLEEVSNDISGMFRCEVTADQPSFFTEIKAAHLEVVELPKQDPVISGLKSRYRLGEMLRANCSSILSYPAANLTWYVNDYPVSPEKVQRHKRVHPDGHFQSSDSIFRTTVIKQLFSRGRLKIRCVASLYNVYYKSSENSVELEKKRHKAHHGHMLTPVPFTTTMMPMVQWGLIPQASERHPQDTTLIFETKQRPENAGHRAEISMPLTTVIFFITSICLHR